MNKERRKQLNKISDTINNLREELEGLSGEEEEAREAMPESLHGSERYDDSERYLSNIDEAANNLQEAQDQLGEIE